LLTLKTPVHHLMAGWLPAELNNILDYHVGRYYEAATAPFWYKLRVTLELIVGMLLVISGGLTMVNRTRQGAALGYLALLVSLTAVDPLLYYFEQFSTVTTTSIQYLLLLEVLYYQRRLASRWPLPRELYHSLSKALGQQRTA
jgi:hypothetical protein